MLQEGISPLGIRKTFSKECSEKGTSLQVFTTQLDKALSACSKFEISTGLSRVLH